MLGAPRSKDFDDVYFSVENGLAETRHVFLDGNNLPAAWEGQELFSIGENGFGTGLNFLATWLLFEEMSDPGQRLHFTSFEQYPLSVSELEAALSPFSEEIGGLMEVYLSQYPNIETPNVKLTFIEGDVNEQLPKFDAVMDCWFLDGFTPSKNPEMWTDIVFENMARCSRKGTTLASFTAAGFVRRGLQEAGFEIEKREGYARKRDMTVGYMP